MSWPSSDTRTRMVSSAALLLREHGVAGTSFAKVLEHSGGPRGSIGHHFPAGKRELVADAVRWAGEGASVAMRHAMDRGDDPAQLFSMICGFYRRALVDSGFAASCPVGAVAQEAYGDAALRDAVRAVFDDWRTLLTEALTATGHSRRAAADLAEVCIAALEGALMLARIERSAAPVDRVERQLAALLSQPPSA